MPKAIRYKHNGQYLQNTLFWTSNSVFIGAHHGVETDAIFDAEIAAIEEAETIASHKRDFAIAFGVPADEIECEVLPWDGREETLPYHADTAATVKRVPEEERDGYVAPEPQPPTLEEQVADLNAKLAAVSAYAGVPKEVIDGAKG